VRRARRCGRYHGWFFSRITATDERRVGRSRYLGHKSIGNGVKYTELAPNRFQGFSD
jgi:hypothetical protein